MEASVARCERTGPLSLSGPSAAYASRAAAPRVAFSDAPKSLTSHGLLGLAAAFPASLQRRQTT